MPIYEYSIRVYYEKRKVVNIPVYVKLTQKAADYGDDPFTEDVNSSGPSGELENVLQEKVSAIEKRMANIIGAKEDVFKGILDYSFPIEKVSDNDVDIEPDYVYEWFQEASPSDEELLEQWNNIKKRLGLDTLDVKEYYVDRANRLIPQSVDDVIKFLETGYLPSSGYNGLSILFTDIIPALYEASEDQQTYALETLHERLDLLL